MNELILHTQVIVSREASVLPVGVAVPNTAINLTYTAATIAALRALPAPLVSGYSAQVLGYYAASDCNLPFYRFDAANLASDNGGTIIKPNTISVGNPGRWVAILHGALIDIRWFGAKGDQVADDQPAIQSAINACAVGGGIYVPVGKYKLSAPITLSKAIRVIGEGATCNPNIQTSLADTIGSVLFVGSGGGNAINIQCDPGCLIEGVSLYGNGSNGSPGILIGADADVNVGTIVRNCRIQNFAIGIHHWRAAFAVIKANKILCPVCIKVENYYKNDSGDSTITENTLFGVTDCIQWISSGGLRVINNKLFCGSIGFRMLFAPGTLTVDLVITGNSFESYSSFAILMESLGTIFTDFVITGNQFASYVGDGSTVQSVIALTGTVADGVIADNMIRHQNQAAIFIGPGVKKINIDSNLIHCEGGANTVSRPVAIDPTAEDIRYLPGLEIGHALPSLLSGAVVGHVYTAQTTASIIGGNLYEEIVIFLPPEGHFKTVPPIAILKDCDSSQFIDFYYKPSGSLPNQLRFVAKSGINGVLGAAPAYKVALWASDGKVINL